MEIHNTEYKLYIYIYTHTLQELLQLTTIEGLGVVGSSGLIQDACRGLSFLHLSLPPSKKVPAPRVVPTCGPARSLAEAAERPVIQTLQHRRIAACVLVYHSFYAVPLLQHPQELIGRPSLYRIPSEDAAFAGSFSAHRLNVEITYGLAFVGLSFQ